MMARNELWDRAGSENRSPEWKWMQEFRFSIDRASRAGVRMVPELGSRSTNSGE